MILKTHVYEAANVSWQKKCHSRAKRLILSHFLSQNKSRKTFYLYMALYFRRKSLRRVESFKLPTTAPRFKSGDPIVDHKSKFRFDVQNLQKLSTIIFPEEFIKTRTRLKSHREESLCIVLGRLSSASRWVDMEVLFGRSRFELSEIGHCAV